MDIDKSLGYIKIWISFLDDENQLLKNSNLWQLYCWCYMKAHHVYKSISIKNGRGYIEIKIAPGSFIASRNNGAIELSISPSTFWSRLHILKKNGFIEIEKNIKHSVIKINDYSNLECSEECDSSRRKDQCMIQDMLFQPSLSEQSKKKCPFKGIIKLYHEILCPPLPRIIKFTERRKKQIKARWQGSEKAQNLNWWKDFFENIRDIPFLMGKNERKWRADLEWLTKEENFIKIIEGRYQI